MNITTRHVEKREKIMTDKKIVILETKHCDTRALKEGEKLKRDEVEYDTKAHIDAVVKCGKFMADKINEQFAKHDHTKLGEHLDDFADALSSRLKDKEFKELPWWKTHLTERHHLNDKAPEDVNLIDVLEMICDCCVAGMARTGEVYDLDLPDEVLKKAFKNTAEMIKKDIKVEKDDADEKDKAMKLFGLDKK